MQVAAIGIDKEPRRSIQAVVLILACLLFLPVVGAASAPIRRPLRFQRQRSNALSTCSPIRTCATGLPNMRAGAKAVPVDASVAPAAAPPPSTEDDREMPSTCQKIASLRTRLVRLIRCAAEPSPRSDVWHGV